MRYGLLQVVLESFPSVDIFRVDTAILECFRDPPDLIDPKLVHLDIGLSNFNDVHLPK